MCESIDRRRTRYFATVKTEEAVRNHLERNRVEPRLEFVEHVGVENALYSISDGVTDLDDEQDVVVDVMDPIENAASTSDYVEFLNGLSQALLDTDSVAFLSCLDSGHEPENRELTLSIADYVLRLVSEREGKTITYYLEVPKASGVSLSSEDRVFELDVGRYVRIDRTRNI